MARAHRHARERRDARRVARAGGREPGTRVGGLRAAGDRDANRLHAGVAVTTSGRTGDSIPAEITIQPEVDRVVHLRYLAGAWQRIEEKLAWRTDTVAARSVITSSLYDALHAALSDRLPRGKRSELVWKLADIFEYRVDMSRDLQPGDSVRLLVERRSRQRLGARRADPRRQPLGVGEGSRRDPLREA